MENNKLQKINIKLSEAEENRIIDQAAKKIIDKYRSAFEELAK